MSYVTTDIGHLVGNRDTGGFTHHNESPSNSNGNNNNNNNNDVEKMICDNIDLSENASNTKTVDVASTVDIAQVDSSNVADIDGDLEGRGESDREFMALEDRTHQYSRDDRARIDAHKYRLNVKHETVIISQMDGFLDSSGKRSSLYKCHLCGKLGATLEKLRRHLAAHSRKLPLRCSVCDVRFQLRPQLSFHLKTQHGSISQVADEGGLFQVEKSSLSAEPENFCIDVSASRTCAELSSSSKCERPVSRTEDQMDLRKESTIKDSGAVKTRASSVSLVGYSNGLSKYSAAQDVSDISAQSYSNCSNVSSLNANSLPGDRTEDFRGNSPLFGGKTIQDFASKSGSGILKVSAKNLENQSRVDSAKGLDMTCQAKSQVDGRADLASKSGVEALLDHSHMARSGVIDLATKIRETEHLGDDVTVVIPSDVPIDEDDAKCEAEDSESTCQNKIIHAPHKSILGNSQLRTKRKLSASAMNTPTSSAQSASDPTSKMIHSSSGSGGKHPPDDYSGHHMSIVPGTSTGSLPLSVYNPLALSSFVQGFNGLMSSSLLSPIITQTPLGFPGMLVNPLSLYAAQLSSGSIAASLMGSKAAGMPTAVPLPLGCGQRDSTPAGGSRSESLHLETLADGGSCSIKEELSGSNGSGCCSSTDGYASPNSKCSSLSRTHSRLNVIQKPIRRENAYKPIVMSDGRTAYHCLYCNKNFCTISDVNRHMDFHEDIRPYKCRFCNYYARTNSQLKVHMMRHQGIRDFLCRLCNYKGVTQSDLNRHTKSQIHMMKERNVCALCREGFVSPMNLEQHRIEKHFKMENCGDSGVKYHLTMAGLVKENAAN